MTLAAHAPVGAPSTWVLSQPRRHPARSPGTAARTRRFAFPAKRFGTPTDLELGRRPRPRRGAAHRGAARQRSTSTRATSSACPRSRTCRSSCSRTRCTSARAASTRAATDAACRCPGRASHRAVRLQLPTAPDAVAAAARRVGGAHRRGAGGRPGLDALTSTARRSRLRSASCPPRRRPAEWLGRRVGPTRARLPARRRLRRASSNLGDEPIAASRRHDDPPLQRPARRRDAASRRLHGLAATDPPDRRGRDSHHATEALRAERLTRPHTTKGKTMKSPARVAARRSSPRSRRSARSPAAAARGGGSDSGKTELRVATFPPGADAAAYDAFADAGGAVREGAPRHRHHRCRVRVGGPDVRRAARRRQPARRLHGALHRRQDAARERPAHGRHRRGRRARLRRQASTRSSSTP